MKVIKRYFNLKFILPIRCKIVEMYDNFRIQELCFRMENCQYDISVTSYEDFEKEVGKGTAYRIFEDMMEDCYSEPSKYGECLDREGGNWLFESYRYFCKDRLLLEFEVQDGNWSGTNILNFEVTYES